jgi:4-amino-4-deoxy-L-arabinose transferase-like glycosyltransferase
MRARVSPRSAVVLLLMLAAGHQLWNAWSQPGFWGYDEGAHAGYAHAILHSAALPHPLSGWSSFHPPAYHLSAAATWWIFDGSAPQTALLAMRMISGLGILAAGAVVYRLARKLAGSDPIALCATVLTLFVPVAQLSGTMLGNEAMAAGFAALALPPLVALQQDPRRLGSAVWSGLFAGLAMATKYSGVWVLVVCVVPFLRRDLDRSALRSLAACFAVALLVAGPVYLRNLALTGTPIPFTRTLEPMREHEQRMFVRDRLTSDYLTLPLRCGQHPFVQVLAPDGRIAGVEPAMLNVPCLTYAGIWFDPFGVRANRSAPEQGVLAGFVLMLLGLIPTGVMAIGFLGALRRAVSTRGRAAETPLVALSLLGVVSYIGFTWVAPSLSAAKASYLLPLLAPAGVFFAIGAAALPSALRIAALVVSTTAAVVAGWIFTTGAFFPASQPAGSKFYWGSIGSQLPDSHIVEAVLRLIP